MQKCTCFISLNHELGLQGSRVASLIWTTRLIRFAQIILHYEQEAPFATNEVMK